MPGSRQNPEVDRYLDGLAHRRLDDILSLRAEILEGRQPLGGLLNRRGIRYRSEPRGFLKLAPDSAMGAHFGLAGSHTLYGRSNVLLGDGGRVLARIVEVLRP